MTTMHQDGVEDVGVGGLWTVEVHPVCEGLQLVLLGGRGGETQHQHRLVRGLLLCTPLVELLQTDQTQHHRLKKEAVDYEG